MSEGALLERRADPHAFERECERLRPLGEAYVRRQFGGQLNHADAQDAVAEVVIRLHRHATRGERPENLRAAFFTGVHNAAIDQLRGRQVKPTVALDLLGEVRADGVEPSEYAELRQDGAVLAEALAAMRRNYRQALLLRFGVGLTIPEIAKRLQISVEAAKKVVLRATRQARRKLLEVTSEAHCEEMQGLAKQQLYEKYVARLASEQEVAELERHLEHCGRCKSLVVNLHHNLHELAGGALLSTAMSDQLSGAAGVAEHLGAWMQSAGDASQALAEKARTTGFKLGNALQGGEAATGGALVGTGQKIAAICATGAAATCVGAGVVGPGVGGVDIVQGGEPEKPAAERPAEPPASTVVRPAEAVNAPSSEPVDSTASAKPAAPTPAQQQSRELGFEQTAASAPSGGSGGSGGGEFGGATGSGSGGGGSGGGSRENFGF